MAAIEAAYERSGTEMRERFLRAHRDASIGEQVRLFIYAANGAPPSPDADVVVADLAELPRALGVPQA